MYHPIQGHSPEVQLVGSNPFRKTKISVLMCQNVPNFYYISSKMMGSRTCLGKLMVSAEPVKPVPTTPLQLTESHNSLFYLCSNKCGVLHISKLKIRINLQKIGILQTFTS